MTLSRLLAVALLAAPAAAGARAQRPAHRAPRTVAPAPISARELGLDVSPTRVEGTVRKADLLQRCVVLTDPEGHALRLTVAADAEITLNGAPATVEDLKPGAQVRAAYAPAGSQAVAVRLEGRDQIHEVKDGQLVVKPRPVPPIGAQARTPPRH